MEKAGQTNLADLVGERPPHFVTTLRKPVIAAINGSCVGIGLTQALMCDVRFAAAGAKFAAVFARRGLIAEFGISWILPRLTTWGVALDLLLSGRTFLAEEAAELGLVKEVVAPENLMRRALDYAEDIAQNCSPGFDGRDQSGRSTATPRAMSWRPRRVPRSCCTRRCRARTSSKGSPASSRSGRRSSLRSLQPTLNVRRWYRKG